MGCHSRRSQSARSGIQDHADVLDAALDPRSRLRASGMTRLGEYIDEPARKSRALKVVFQFNVELRFRSCIIYLTYDTLDL
jgi:hypothetical protein